MSDTATLSSKYQISIPKAVRTSRDWEAGQVFAFVEKAEGACWCRFQAGRSATALEAARVCAAHKLATADAIIYATARNNNAELLTCDAHFNPDYSWDGLVGVVVH